MNDKSPNIEKRKPNNPIPYNTYMKMIVEAVVDDYKYYGNKFKKIDHVILYLEKVNKDNPFRCSPKFETAQKHINKFLKIKKNIPENGNNYSTYKDLLYYSLQEYYKMKLTPKNLLEIDFPQNEDCYYFHPVATLFVKQGCEKDINDILIENFSDMIQGTVTGSKCIILYFVNYDKLIEFLRLFFPDRVDEADENIQQSNTVDDIDDSDDKTEEKEKI